MSNNLKTYNDGIAEERKRILDGILAIEAQSHRTKTPIYQDTFFELAKDLIEDLRPPRRFRDIGNGE